jgi:triacylglycerol lipase
MSGLKRFFYLAFVLFLAACGSVPSGESRPPVVFVHGNGDTAALWMPTIWRFESNGWPRERLFAVDLPHPLARSDDGKPQPGRTSAAENRQNLAAEIERVRARTGAQKVALVGNSRGGNVIRDYVRNGGADKVSHVVIGGGVSHGIWLGDFNPGSEFNGSGSFMKALNAPQGAQGLEVTPGVAFMTLRSDSNDKYAQPDGRWIGQPKMATGIGYDGPELKGAENVVLPALDHREVSYHPLAFVQTWRFVSGHFPGRVEITPEDAVTLDGRITGFQGNDQTNLPFVGATLEIYEVAAQTGERLGAAAHVKTVGADGQWGPFQAKPTAHYEFVIRAEGFATTHIYRSPFPRSTSILHMRPARLAEADKDGSSVITMTRPRGYFGVGRDTMSLDGKPPAGIPPGVPGVSSAKLKLKESAVRSVPAVFGGERIVVRSWPSSENRVVFAEFHY